MIEGIIPATNPNYKNASTLASKSPIKSFTNLKDILSKKKHGFTLIELIVVIIIVGILAAVGMTQYTLIVEKARTAEAKVRIGAMRQLAYQYYLENGSLYFMQNSHLGVDNTCTSSDFFKYERCFFGYVELVAWRCTSGGKTPNASRGYRFYLTYYPDTGKSVWHCYYNDNALPCFGLTRW